MKKMKIKMKRLIADTITILGSYLVIGLVGFVIGVFYQNTLLSSGQSCFTKSELIEHNKEQYTLAGEDCADDFVESYSDYSVYDCISRYSLISEVGSCPIYCPPVPDCPEIEIVECEEEDCSEEFQKGFAECTAQSKMYE